MNQIRDIRSIVQNVATHTAKRDEQRALRKAHTAAADFHEAISEALEAREEILDGSPDPYWVTRYQAELGRAAVALQAMPMKWAAVLGAELDAAKLPQQAAECPTPSSPVAAE